VLALGRCKGLAQGGVQGACTGGVQGACTGGVQGACARRCKGLVLGGARGLHQVVQGACSKRCKGLALGRCKVLALGRCKVLALGRCKGRNEMASMPFHCVGVCFAANSSLKHWSHRHQEGNLRPSGSVEYTMAGCRGLALGRCAHSIFTGALYNVPPLRGKPLKTK